MSWISTALPPIEVRLTRLPNHDPKLPLPSYQTRGAAGMDLSACLPDQSPVTLEPMARRLIPTGLAMALPDGWEGQIRPRSGLALDRGVTVANAPGTIDSDYRGEVRVLLINLGTEDCIIMHGDRVAQLVIAPVQQAQWVEKESLDDTRRGRGGFGSTGI